MPLRSAPPARLCLALLLAPLVGGCSLFSKLDFVEVADANDWNLSQLHNPSGSYRYSADLTGDLEYVMRSGTSGLPLKSSQERALGMKREPVPNPAHVTLENVLDLAQFQAPDREERIAGLQAMWFSRLATSDTSALVRERCALELGRLGARLEIDVPLPLEEDAQPLGPDALGDLLGSVIRGYRLVIAEAGPPEASLAELDAACRAVEEQLFDLEGGRRILYTVGNLLRGLSGNDRARAPLERLSRVAQEQCIELALAEALGDEAAIVRAAAVRASVEAVGLEVLAPVLMQLEREPSAEVQVAVLEIVVERGLPDAPEGMPAELYERARRNWIRVIYRRAVDEPDGHLQLKAMRALAAVLRPGVYSLREEDWEEWWLAREAAGDRRAAYEEAQRAVGPEGAP